MALVGSGSLSSVSSICCYDPGWTNSEVPASVRSQVRVSPTTCLRGIVQGYRLGCIGLLDLTMPGLRSWSNPGRNKKVHFFCYDPGWTNSGGPASVRSQVRVSPTTCLRGIVQGYRLGCIGLLDLTMPGLRRRAHPLTVEEPTITMTVSGTYTAATMIDSSVSHSFVPRYIFFRFSHIRVVSETDWPMVTEVTVNRMIYVTDVYQARVSPTTCLRDIVQGDMVGVYWAARPYDAGPSELVQPGS
ncbi:hypothetical protein LXL04_023441 [Taraxacum kok-saghyz]